MDGNPHKDNKEKLSLAPEWLNFSPASMRQRPAPSRSQFQSKSKSFALLPSMPQKSETTKEMTPIAQKKKEPTFDEEFPSLKPTSGQPQKKLEEPRDGFKKSKSMNLLPLDSPPQNSVPHQIVQKPPTTLPVAYKQVVSSGSKELRNGLERSHSVESIEIVRAGSLISPQSTPPTLSPSNSMSSFEVLDLNKLAERRTLVAQPKAVAKLRNEGLAPPKKESRITSSSGALVTAKDHRSTFKKATSLPVLPIQAPGGGQVVNSALSKVADQRPRSSTANRVLFLNTVKKREVLMKTVMKKNEDPSATEEKSAVESSSTGGSGSVNSSPQTQPLPAPFVVPAPTPAPFVLTAAFFSSSGSKIASGYAKDRGANKSPSYSPLISPLISPNASSSTNQPNAAMSDANPSMVLSPPSPRSPLATDNPSVPSINVIDEEKISEEEEQFLKSCGWEKEVTDSEFNDWLTEEEIREFQSRSQQKVQDLSRSRDMRKVEYDQSIKEWYEKRFTPQTSLQKGLTQAQDDTDSETELE